MIETYIGLGSNLDDPHAQITKAIQALSNFPQSKLTAASSLYVSKPWGEGTENQPDYINAVACLYTTLEPSRLLALLLSLEQEHGRVREKRYGSRTLDCDLLLYGTQVILTESLVVPHPRMHLRSFVLLPLAEINPHLIINNVPLGDHLHNCDCSTIQKLA